MRVIGIPLLTEFGVKHADIRSQLTAWLNETEEAEWKEPSDIKRRYPAVSFLSDNLLIFNLKGNAYRLAVKVDYQAGIVLIMRIGTHADYSKWRF